MLFFHECKKVVFSITFLVLIAGVLLMTGGQGVLDFSVEKIEMPQPGQESYGIHTKEVPEVIMPAALTSLYAEFGNNTYPAYPIGFYKNVRLNDAQQRKMADVLCALTGIPAEELMKAYGKTSKGGKHITFENGKEMTVQGEGSYKVTLPDNAASNRTALSPVTLKAGISYDEFKAYMQQADDLIGGGSNYSGTYLRRFGRVPITYEEAIESYNLAKENDHFTGAYARLFSDYLVIVLSILPVFVATAVCLKDRRTRMSELVHSKKASSAQIILTRYLAIITAVMIPSLILSYLSSISTWRLYDGLVLDYLSPLKYDVGWVLPSVMISTAIGMFLTELTNTPIAIFVQGLWWFIDINMGVQEIDGGYSLFRLAPRHNTLSGTQTFIDNFGNLAANRLLFTGFALVLAAATVVIYEQKRRGRLNGYGKIKKTLAGVANRKNQSAA